MNKLPLKSGSQFIVVTDDGDGVLICRPIDIIQGTHTNIDFFKGEVSSIQTVGSSSDTSCLIAQDSPTSLSFTLDPPVPSQCSTQTISWNPTVYQEPPYIRVFIPGSRAFHPRLTPVNVTRQAWDVNVQEGTRMFLLVQSVGSLTRDREARTSPLIRVTGKSSQCDACLDENSLSSMVTVSLTTTTSRIASTLTASTLITMVPGFTHPDQGVRSVSLFATSSARSREAVRPLSGGAYWLTILQPTEDRRDYRRCCCCAWYLGNGLHCNRPPPIFTQDQDLLSKPVNSSDSAG